LVVSDTPLVYGILYFMQIIVTSPKYGNQIAIIDRKDYKMVNEYHWVLDVRKNGRRYARATIKIGVNNFKYIYMHRLIMGFPKKKTVDHIDHDGLNNCRKNLRIASNAQNLCNVKVQAGSKTGYKGVYKYPPHRYNGKYSTQIFSNGKRIFGGYFKTAEDAARKYNELAIKYHGEYAFLNKIPNE